ncbi:CvpA family protein [bacterium]|nr:CvpA family protein [bacterium]
MVWVDYFILAIIAISAVISLFRGFVKELLSLVTWVLAFWVAIKFAPWLESAFAGYISAPSARLGLAYVVLFLLVLIVGAIATHFMTELVKRTHFSGTDRMVGVLFGIGRGLVLLTVLVMLAQVFTPVEQDPWWSQSTFIPHFERMAEFARSFLPEDWQQELSGAPAEAPPEPQPEAQPSRP